MHIAPRLGARDDSLWVTARTDQSESLLAGRPHLFVPEVPPRDPVAVLAAMAPVVRHLATHRGRYAAAYSTGAALALAVLPTARGFGLPATYIESMARTTGPSLTGRVLAHTPGIRLTTQASGWADRRWRYTPWLVEAFESFDAPAHPAPMRAFVTVGTQDKYPFDAMVSAVSRLGVAPASTWQVGLSRVDVSGRRLRQMSVPEFDRAATAADVVITHGGVGSLLRLWALGVYPVVVPRRRSRGEHVDDHQLEIAEQARLRDLALVREADELTLEDLETAAGRRVRPRPQRVPAVAVR